MNTSHVRQGGAIPTAIVLAAGGIPAALRPFVGNTSSAMLPVNGRPIVHWSLKYLLDWGIERVVVGLRADEMHLPRFLQHTFGSQLQLSFMPVSEDKGPAYTLLLCLAVVESAGKCLVVLGDTLFEFPESCTLDSDETFVLTAPVEDADRWCLAAVGMGNRVTSLNDKPSENREDWPALIGVYHFQDVRPLRDALTEQLASGSSSLQMRHALQPYIDSGQLRAHHAAEWLDCGNPDLLTSSRRRLLLARSFNTLQLDELRGTITKRSEHRAKFLNEINYYRLLPVDLVTFFPRLVDFSLDPEDTFLTLEYYGYRTLSEVWVFEEYDAKQWRRVFENLSEILACFSRYTVELSPTATAAFYWSKSVERIEAFSGQSADFCSLVAMEAIVVNGVVLRGWKTIEGAIENRVRTLSNQAVGRLIHGDLCFSNILFDPLSRLFKFIDPRGSFSEAGVMGDPRYDIAKLLHSLDGGYDFFVHDMFTLQHQGVNITLEQFFPKNREAVMLEFKEVFCQQFDWTELRVLEGLLFLSMCALHKDKPLRQVAMFATGIRILNDALQS